jgi:hypothetical protein
MFQTSFFNGTNSAPTKQEKESVNLVSDISIIKTQKLSFKAMAKES